MAASRIEILEIEKGQNVEYGRAIVSNDLTTLKRFTEATPSIVNEIVGTRCTPLLLSIYSDKLDVFNYLFEQKADINKGGINMVSPLNIAVYSYNEGNKESLKYIVRLLAAGANVDVQTYKLQIKHDVLKKNLIDPLYEGRLKRTDDAWIGNLGYMFYELGEYDKALEYMLKVADINFETQYNLICCYLKIKAYDKALQYMMRYFPQMDENGKRWVFSILKMFEDTLHLTPAESSKPSDSAVLESKSIPAPAFATDLMNMYLMLCCEHWENLEKVLTYYRIAKDISKRFALSLSEAHSCFFKALDLRKETLSCKTGLQFVKHLIDAAKANSGEAKVLLQKILQKKINLSKFYTIYALWMIENNRLNLSAADMSVLKLSEYRRFIEGMAAFYGDELGFEQKPSARRAIPLFEGVVKEEEMKAPEKQDKDIILRSKLHIFFAHARLVQAGELKEGIQHCELMLDQLVKSSPNNFTDADAVSLQMYLFELLTNVTDEYKLSVIKMILQWFQFEASKVKADQKNEFLINELRAIYDKLLKHPFVQQQCLDMITFLFRTQYAQQHQPENLRELIIELLADMAKSYQKCASVHLALGQLYGVASNIKSLTKSLEYYEKLTQLDEKFVPTYYKHVYFELGRLCSLSNKLEDRKTGLAYLRKAFHLGVFHAGLDAVKLAPSIVGDEDIDAIFGDFEKLLKDYPQSDSVLSEMIKWAEETFFSTEQTLKFKNIIQLAASYLKELKNDKATCDLYTRIQASHSLKAKKNLLFGEVFDDFEAREKLKSALSVYREEKNPSVSKYVQENHVIAIYDLLKTLQPTWYNNPVRRPLYLATKLLLLTKDKERVKALYHLEDSKLNEMILEASNFIKKYVEKSVSKVESQEFYYHKLACWYQELVDRCQQSPGDPDVYILCHALNRNCDLNFAIQHDEKSSTKMIENIISGMQQTLNVDDQWMEAKIEKALKLIAPPKPLQRSAGPGFSFKLPSTTASLYPRLDALVSSRPEISAAISAETKMSPQADAPAAEEDSSESLSHSLRMQPGAHEQVELPGVPSCYNPDVVPSRLLTPTVNNNSLYPIGDSQAQLSVDVVAALESSNVVGAASEGARTTVSHKPAAPRRRRSLVLNS